ncbi:MAG: hypothetical protein H0U70_10375 [Tatlockia sp.]|nr:hypothetical protein [Tatlockia sp.]
MLSKIELPEGFSEETPIHVEHEHKVSSLGSPRAVYNLHFSLPSAQLAKNFFIFLQVKGNQYFPLILKENRVIITGTAEYKGEGIFTYNNYLRLNISSAPVSENLHSVFNLLGLQTQLADYDNSIHFPNILHPDFSIENRKRIFQESIKRCVFSIMILDLEFPQDLVCFIIKLLLIDDYTFRQVIEITKIFKLPQEKFKPAYQSVDCLIQYLPANEQNPAGLFLLNCLDKLESNKLANNMNKALSELRRFDIQIQENVISIRPRDLYFDYDESGVKKTLALKFANYREAATFYSFVNFKGNDAILKNDLILFPKLPDKPYTYQNGCALTLFAPNKIKQDFIKITPATGWNLTSCDMFILGCIPVVGWAILLAYLIYQTCLPLADEPLSVIQFLN